MEYITQLGEMTINDIYHLYKINPVIVKMDTSITEVLGLISENLTTHHIYVTDNNNRLIGSLCVSKFIEYLFPIEAMIELSNEMNLKPLSSIKSKSLEEIINTQPSFVYEKTKLRKMASCLLSEKIDELPVVNNDMEIVGQVNIHEVIKAYLGTLAS